MLAYSIINMPPERKKMQTQKGSIVRSGGRRRGKNNTHEKKGKQETKENLQDWIYEHKIMEDGIASTEGIVS